MIYRQATRLLLRELTSYHRASRPLQTRLSSIAIRSFTTTQHPRNRIPPYNNNDFKGQQQPPPQPNLQNLSHLSPAQIKTLLSTIPPPPPQPPQTPQTLGANPYQYQQQQHQDPTRARRRALLLRAFWAILFFGLGYNVTWELLRRIAPLHPFISEAPVFADYNDQRAYRALANLQAVAEVPALNSMMEGVRADQQDARSNSREKASWEAWEAYADLPPDVRAHHLTASPAVLFNPDGLGLVHAVFRNRHTGELVVAVAFGDKTTGWPGLVHGGAISTIMDEALARLAVRHLPAGAAVTANLSLNFRRAVIPHEIYLVRTFKVIDDPESADGDRDVDGGATGGEEKGGATGGEEKGGDSKTKSDRKMWVIGRMEDTSGAVVCEAKGLFVVPKGIELQPLGKHF